MNIEELSAYEILEKREIRDVSSTAYRLRHKKTGARIAILSNDDENKVFYIGFRTPPADSTGVAHITEHSVLCGSRDFPLKDPFVELAKGSLNTFLNAMTYPDKTVYPVASCNDKDFKNLMHVYLDAVFYPNTYVNESIFRQEGWHYEFDEEGKLFINGVVYNEMKGAFSSPEDVLSREVMNALYPDNSYGVESGGDPEVIPELTYEQFLDFHRKYYHPSNSYIYLYGKMDIAERLDYIDKEYLSAFDRLEIDSEIKFQQPFDSCRRFVRECPLAEGESEEENTYLSINYSLGRSTDKKLYLTMQILDDVLCTVPGAPIKKALVEKGIASDVYSTCENGIMQPYFSIVAKDTSLSKEEEFLSTVREVLQDIVDNGFDKKALLGGINHFEFQYREADFGRFPKGLMYGLQAFDSWLYDDELPFAHIEALDTIDFLKKNVDKGYFENFVRTYLLENPHSAIVLLKPELGLQEKKDEQLKIKMAEFQKSLTEKEINELKEKYEKLKAFQEKVDTPEELATLPLLERKDLKREATGFKNKELNIAGTRFILHDYKTNGIGYLRLIFTLKDLPGELYPYASLLKTILGQIDTDNYNYSDINNEIMLATGGFNVTGGFYCNVKDNKDYQFTLQLGTKYLHNRLDEVISLIEEIMFRSHLGDADRIYEILAETKSQLQGSMISAAHSVAIGRANAGISSSGRIAEIMSGIDYYRFIADIVDNYDDRKAEVCRKLKRTLKSVFRPENLIVDLTADKGKEKKFEELLPRITEKLFTVRVRKEHFNPKPISGNEAFITSGQVLYVCRAGDFKEAGLEFNGALNILKTIMGYQYLWVNVRVKGGAYGCFAGFTKSGNSFFVSYRDPNLSKTIEVYENAPEAVRNLELDERSMTQFIIGTISETDQPLNPAAKGVRSFDAYMMGETLENIQKRRIQIIDAQPDDIRALAPYVEALLSKKRLVVVGNATKIKEEAGLFETIDNLL